MNVSGNPSPQCIYCQSLVLPDSIFCSTCGKRLKEDFLSTSLSKQILIYSVSFFLAPLGLWWGIKYIKSDNKKARLIGWASIFLTVCSIIITLLLARTVVSNINSQLNLDLNQYQGTGL